MSLQYFEPLLHEVDETLALANQKDVPQILQKMSVDLFALAVWRSNQLQKYQNLSKYLAPLPAPDVQARFAGGHGEALLPRAAFFANYLSRAIDSNIGHANPRILDYGCGWGRISRLLPYFTTLDNIFLRDPNPSCPKYFGADFLKERYDMVARVPSPAMIPEFDVCFLFSIFTHTPEEVTRTILSALSCHRHGIIIFTMRPETIWSHSPSFPKGFNGANPFEEHQRFGYAFVGQSPTDTEYGDSSYSYSKVLEIARSEGLQLLDATFSLVDPLQIMFTFRVG